MLEKIVTLYRKTEMGIISNLSGANSEVLEETSFYDVGFIQSRIRIVQKELKRIGQELETSVEMGDISDYAKRYRRELLLEREKLLYRMIFWASNSFYNLDDCFKLAEGHTFEFMKCVQALEEYNKGDKEKAFRMLEAYQQAHGKVEEHYLINKVYGLLLARRGAHQEAIPFLTDALQLLPDDMESLSALKECYICNGEPVREAVIEEIIEMLV